MKISFLVTFYNEKQYVEDSLNSILAIEKPCDWEILVGDDGSTDGTVDVVQQYIRNYPHQIKLFVMPRELNQKYDSVKRASENRLNLLEHAEGDVFCTLDGDDYYCDTNFVKDALDAMRTNENISVVAFGYKYVTDGVEGEQYLITSEESSGLIDKRVYLTSLYIPAGACVFKTLWGHDRLQYLKEIGYFDDNDIVINSLYYGDMYAFGRAVYAYRQTGMSVFTSMNELERAVLNVEGMDVDVKLIPPEFQKELWIRNSRSIIMMYMWKKQLKEILGKDVFDEYLTAFREIKDSVGYEMMIFDELTDSQKHRLKSRVRELEKKEIKYTIKTLLKKALRGF